MDLLIKGLLVESIKIATTAVQIILELFMLVQTSIEIMLKVADRTLGLKSLVLELDFLKPGLV